MLVNGTSAFPTLISLDGKHAYQHVSGRKGVVAVLQVYLDPCTVNSRKVLAGLELLGTKHEVKHVDYFTGAHKRPEYLAINPNGAVPAAMDGDFALSESNAILQYAADLNASDMHYPKDLK